MQGNVVNIGVYKLLSTKKHVTYDATHTFIWQPLLSKSRLFCGQVAIQNLYREKPVGKVV